MFTVVAVVLACAGLTLDLMAAFSLLVKVELVFESEAIVLVTVLPKSEKADTV